MNPLKIENGSRLIFMQLMEKEKNKQKNCSFTQKKKITISGLYYLCLSLGLKTCIGGGDDKFNDFHLNTVMSTSDEKKHKIINFGRVDDYVYDIETDSLDFKCEFPLMVQNADPFVLDGKTKDIIKNLKNLEDLFDFSNFNENHELFSIKNKKVIGKFEIETPENNWIDGFICGWIDGFMDGRKEIYAVECGNYSKNKLKGTHQSCSRSIKFDD